MCHLKIFNAEDIILKAIIHRNALKFVSIRGSNPQAIATAFEVEVYFIFEKKIRSLNFTYYR
jgi:hypothetical protein